MPSIPSAEVVVQDSASAVASGTDVICVLAPVPVGADITPRMFGGASAVYAQHGYNEGVEYVAYHVTNTRKPVYFVGLPIGTPGVIGREDTSGNTGSSVSTLAAGSSGVLAEHDGVLTVIKGGTVGTDQIILGLSLDGGLTTRRLRLGTATSKQFDYVGITVSLTVGTLVAGDTIHTWHGSGPLSDSADWTAARTALAAKLQGFRSVLLIGDLQQDTDASAYLAELNAYETENQRFIYGRAALYDRLPQAAMAQVRARMTGSPTLTFAEVGGTGDTITRSAGSWTADGFAVGDTITVTGSVSNNVTGPIADITTGGTVIVLGTTDLVNENAVAGCTVVGTPTLTFAEVGASGDTITRSRGSWLDDGFRTGDVITIVDTVSNNVASATLTNVTATVLTLDTTDLTAETIGSYGVSITAGQTKATWAAELVDEFEGVDGEFRLDMSMGRYPVVSPFSGWFRRIPAAWVASVREYQHDLHVATWRKMDGPAVSALDDASDEYDDRTDGQAASLSRFTSLRTWGNGPGGIFVSNSLTRATEGSLLSLTNNVAVVNLACTVCQLATENIVGRSLVLDDEGHATSDSLSTITSEVNTALDLALLQNRGEGQRCSKAVWTPSADDLLNVPEANLTGVLDLVLNGVVHKVTTTVKVR